MTSDAGEEVEVDLASIIEDTPDEVWELAGGFGLTDEIASKLNARWRKQANGPVIVSAVDLAWLLDGYARARLAVSGSQGVDR